MLWQTLNIIGLAVVAAAVLVLVIIRIVDWRLQQRRRPTAPEHADRVRVLGVLHGGDLLAVRTYDLGPGTFGDDKATREDVDAIVQACAGRDFRMVVDWEGTVAGQRFLFEEYDSPRLAETYARAELH